MSAAGAPAGDRSTGARFAACAPRSTGAHGIGARSAGGPKESDSSRCTQAWRSDDRGHAYRTPGRAAIAHRSPARPSRRAHRRHALRRWRPRLPSEGRAWIGHWINSSIVGSPTLLRPCAAFGRASTRSLSAGRGRLADDIIRQTTTRSSHKRLVSGASARFAILPEVAIHVGEPERPGA